jgi:hypothetical protein
MYISYGIYALSESLSRFSIGCADTICMIFFITIPLLHSNTITKDGIENSNIDENLTEENNEKIKEGEKK